jgi:catechol 2,3-dioxygenase-like lactoylglutathione lyase family enzyme
MAETVALEHVGIRTTADTFDATIAFYTDVLGWKVIEERPASNPDDRVFFISDGRGGAFEVWVGSGPPIEDPSHVAFAVSFDEFPTLAERFSGSGVVLEEPFINEVGDRISFFNDPAGNRAQIIGRLKTLPSRDG